MIVPLNVGCEAKPAVPNEVSVEPSALSRQMPSFPELVPSDFAPPPGERLDVRHLPARLRAILWMTGGTIRWTTIARMLDGGYMDVYRMFHKGDAGFTFPTWSPHVRLDYAFVPTVFASRVTACEIVRDAPSLREASDHFPLLSVFGEE